jgi:hypothetical protein
MPLLVTTFLTLFLNGFSLQGKEASKLAGNCCAVVKERETSNHKFKIFDIVLNFTVCVP